MKTLAALLLVLLGAVSGYVIGVGLAARHQHALYGCTVHGLHCVIEVPK